MNIAILVFLAANAMRPGGDMRDGAMGPPPGGASAPAGSFTLDAMPYTRTVSCDADGYQILGTYTGALPTWSASPSGASGSCTDIGQLSCQIDVDPDATGEGVETITITNGSQSEVVTIGFYVAGAHSCFLSQNINGSYNVGLADLDAVTTWENVGTSALDVTQATAGRKPTYRTGIVGGQPVVRCDGGDWVTATTASDWTFLNDGTDWTIETVYRTTMPDPESLMTVASTTTSLVAVASRGVATGWDDRSSASRDDRAITSLSNGAAYNWLYLSLDNALSANAFNLMQLVLDDDGGAGVDSSQFANGAAAGTAARASTYSASAPSSALSICATSVGNTALNGDVFRVLVYQSALSATQRGINEAVDEWALGGTLPVVAAGSIPDPNRWAFIGDSLTSGSGGVETWVSKLSDVKPVGVTFYSYASSGNNITQIFNQYANNCREPTPGRLFILGGINSIIGSATGASVFSTYNAILAEADLRGTEIIVLPTSPFGNYFDYTGAKGTELIALNNAINASPIPAFNIDLYTLMGEVGTPEDLAATYDIGDGLHYSETGTQFIADEVATALGL